MTSHRPDPGPRRDPSAMDAPTVSLGFQGPNPAASSPQRPARSHSTPPGHGPPQGPAPSNGWAVAALVLGIVCLALSPIPILNQAGILVGLVGVGLGIPAIIVGRRHRVRLVMGAIGTGLSVLGLIASFAFTAAFVSAIDDAFAPIASAPPGMLPVEGGGYLPVGPSTPAEPVTFRYEVTSTGPDAVFVGWSNGTGGTEQEQDVSLPWREEVRVEPGRMPVGVITSSISDRGSLTCTIWRNDEVVATDTASGGSASVSCTA